MSAELFDRLARLRREERAEPVAPARAEREALPAWFTARRAPRAPGAEESAGAGRSSAPPAELAEQTSSRGRFAARTRVFPAGHAHGDWRLVEVLSAASAELAWLARDPALAALAPERCVYLDIETTGLSGGAGTIPFLIALGAFADGEFRLWQAFLRDPAEEAAALAEVAERVHAASGVVSFFGKSFDRHRLEDKMRLHRIAPPFGGKPHLDLYHPLARLYRGSLANARLATFEHELCGVVREDDLPGSLAPAAWFDFLAGRAHGLEGVFRHNEQDVLSLVVLAAHLDCVRREVRPDGRPLAGCGRARARAIAELHAQRREHPAALAWTERALTRPGSDEGELRYLHAETLRQLGERERALAEFLRLARERADALSAKAWLAAGKLALCLRRAELLDEILAQGPTAVQRTTGGRALCRLEAEFAGLEARRSRASRPSPGSRGLEPRAPRRRGGRGGSAERKRGLRGLESRVLGEQDEPQRGKE